MSEISLTHFSQIADVAEALGLELTLDVCCFLVNQYGRTEMILNCLNPKFAKKFVLDYYFEMVQKMKFCVYDIDNNTYDLSDDDFLGELECTLGQVSVTSAVLTQIFAPPCTHLYVVWVWHSVFWVQIVSSRQLTRSLLLGDKRPAGRGTITVSGLFPPL